MLPRVLSQEVTAILLYSLPCTFGWYLSSEIPTCANICCFVYLSDNDAMDAVETMKNAKFH